MIPAGAGPRPTLIESCKAADVEPFAYLTDVLERLPASPPESAEEFTPLATRKSIRPAGSSLPRSPPQGRSRGDGGYRKVSA
jgi:transposase IS66-like protein